MKYKNVSLIDIANWEVTYDKKDNTNNIIAGIPSFQRGLVWKPHQVEFLWDSLFRGFPVGAIIASEKIESQETQKRTDIDIDNVNYHIIDGQQRSHNIALAFYNQFSDEDNISDLQKLRNRSYLWIDLLFQKEKSNRKFLFRLLTPSHPWGYRKDNESSRLKTTKIFEHRVNLGKLTREDRLYAFESYPSDAQFPIPVRWLIDCFKDIDKMNKSTNVSDILFTYIDEKIDKVPKALKDKLTDTEKREELKKQLNYIIKGLTRALEVYIPFIIVSALDENDDDTTEIEILFWRLNQLGTPISRIELAYSMIKAQWAGIEKSIEENAEIASIHPAYMAIQSFRILYQKEAKEEGKANLVAEPDVISIRKKAKTTDNYVFNNAFDYLENQLQDDIARINLLVGENSFLVPKVLMTYIARDSRDVYFWLLWFANQYPDLFEQEVIQKRLLGIVTALDIFGIDKGRAIKYLYENLNDDKDAFSGVFVKLFKLEGNRKGLEYLYTPEDLKQFFSFDKLTGNESNSMRKSLYDFVNANIDHQSLSLENEVWPFINKLRKSRKLLIYAQKKYFFKEKFDEYDVMSSFWVDHNRPWDYDHILPSSVFYRKWHQDYPHKKIADQWINTIGNLRILSFSDNRSRNNEQLNCMKLGTEEKKLFLLDGYCEGFDQAESAFTEKNNEYFENTKNFAQSSSSRLIRIYRNWWEQLDIDYLTFPLTKN